MRFRCAIASFSSSDSKMSIAAFVKSQPNLIFIDTSKVSLGPDGQPQPALFVADKLHFSEAGYKRLVEVVRPYMPKNKK